ncbi:MAG: malto-oligosyltrehalose trehalohydrolase [Pirellulaceae bacterium]|nr:malto-oligosyltrehalose trehalohydrolase [Pirellulaceae bacterium]
MTATPIFPPQGAIRQPDGSVRWCVWAPRCAELTLVMWDQDPPREIRMQPTGEGYFVHEATGVPEGLRYAYRLPDGRTLPDPASRWQPQGVHQPSAVVLVEDFPWSDGGWSGVSLDDLVIYELHVGTFTPSGTFDGVIDRLAALADLGVTAIEIMPISQFPGGRNWGYDGVHPYAAQNTYGGPRGFQRMVDAAHRHGLAVVLDVVYNHLGPEGNYFADFGPYFSDRHHTPWGTSINYDGRDCEPVRRLVIDNALMWVRDFHVDALRLDAIQAIYDLGALHILQELQDEVQREAARQGRRVSVIGETDQNDPRLVTPVERGGYGLDGVWSDDFHHAVHAWLTGQRDGYFQPFGGAEQIVEAYNRVFVRDGRWDPYRRRRHGGPAGDLPRRQFVVCMQNHDQVGNRVGSRPAAAVAVRTLVVHGRGVRRAAALSLLLFLRRCTAAQGRAARPPPRIRALGLSVGGHAPESHLGGNVSGRAADVALGRGNASSRDAAAVPGPAVGTPNLAGAGGGQSDACLPGVLAQFRRRCLRIGTAARPRRRTRRVGQLDRRAREFARNAPRGQVAVAEHRSPTLRGLTIVERGADSLGCLRAANLGFG